LRHYRGSVERTPGGRADFEGVESKKVNQVDKGTDDVAEIG
jgi:hypothetical protein